MRRRSRAADRHLAALKDPAPEVRRAALESLDRLQLAYDLPPRPSARQLDQVFRAVTARLRSDADLTVRVESAYLLTHWFEPRAPTALLAVLDDTAAPPALRGQAAEGIGNVLDATCSSITRSPSLRARAAASLRRGLADPAPEVRCWCLYALGSTKATEARSEIEHLAATDDALPRHLWRVRHEADDVLAYWASGRWPHRDFERAEGDG